MIDIQKHPCKKLIEAINQFNMATQFFEWFAKEELVVKVIFEELTPRIFKRVSEYYLQGHLVLTGGCRFEMAALYQGFYHSLVRTREDIYKLLANFQNLDIKFVAQVPMEAHYTRLSQFFYKDHYCGRVWAIFELPILSEIYENFSFEKR